jgi:hypothetical protein
MLDDYQVSTINQIWHVIPYLIFVSGLYWFNTKSLMKSLHGFLILCAFLYAVIISKYTQPIVPIYYYIPLYLLLISGIISIGLSLTAFKNHRWVHIIHSMTLIAAFVIWFIGSMAIGHDWI